MQAEQSNPVNPSKTNNKKDLLKYQKPIYQLKRNEQGSAECIIAKLMAQKQKPTFGFLPRSQLLSQLDQFIPILKQSNQQLASSDIKQQQQIDAKLQQIQDSSSSSQDEDEMDEEKQMIDEEQQHQQVLESCQQFQFNILTYPYLNSKEQTKTETKKQTNSQIPAANLKKVVEITDSDNTNILEQLQ